MQLQHTWEHNLLNLATEALHVHNEQPKAEMTFEAALLETAYGYCEGVTVEQQPLLSSGFWAADTGQVRAAACALCFCRTSDDIVDRMEGDEAARLAQWRLRATRASADRRPSGCGLGRRPDAL